jgi:hypothetical protein
MSLVHKHHVTEQVGLAVTLQTCIREVFSSNIGQDTGHHDKLRVCGLPPSPQTKTRIVNFRDGTSIRPDRFVPKFFSIQYSSNNLPSNAIF